jgi:hypothetical protein
VLLAPKQLQAELILPTSLWQFATEAGNPIVAVYTDFVYVAQKVVAKAGAPRSWRRQLSALQTSFVVVGWREVDVLVVALDELVVGCERLEEAVLDTVDEEEGGWVLLVLDVESTLEDDDDETGDWETHRTWPTERSQLVSSEGLKA